MEGKGHNCRETEKHRLGVDSRCLESERVTWTLWHLQRKVEYQGLAGCKGLDCGVLPFTAGPPTLTHSDAGTGDSLRED